VCCWGWGLGVADGALPVSLGPFPSVPFPLTVRVERPRCPVSSTPLPRQLDVVSLGPLSPRSPWFWAVGVDADPRGPRISFGLYPPSLFENSRSSPSADSVEGWGTHMEPEVGGPAVGGVYYFFFTVPYRL